MVKTWQEWFGSKEHGTRTYSASSARPYKLDHIYRFQLMGQEYELHGKLIDASNLELIVETDDEDAFVLVLGRSAVVQAMEIADLSKG